jgi:RTX calcium-binding nonapeptide repeat (4 copies)
MRARWGLAGMALALIAAPAARASTAEIVTVDVGDRIDVIEQEQLIVSAGKGEPNRLRLRARGSGGVEVRDTGARLRAGDRCSRKSRHVVVCTPDDVIEVIEVSAGNRNDRVALAKRLPGDVSVSGGPGDDRLSGSRDAEGMSGGAGNDRLTGAGGADSLAGGIGRDVLLGGPGNDTLNAGDEKRAQRDRLDGGPGFDTASWSGSERAVRVRIAGHSLHGGVDRGRRLEALRGGSGRDRLTGSGAADSLDGGGGGDILSGRGGNDELSPGDTPFELDEVRCGRGRDNVAFSQLWALIRGDCERIVDPFDSSVAVRPRIRLLSGGRVGVAAFCGDDETIVCFFDVELRTRDPHSRRLAKPISEPKGKGRTELKFKLSATGRKYLGNGGKVACVADEGSGYCMRVPRR